MRDGGEAAVRARWPGSPTARRWARARSRARPAYAAFNLTVFGHLLGTPLEPDLTGHILMIEEVAEHTYRTDRAMFHITSTPSVRRVAGLRLGPLQRRARQRSRLRRKRGRGGPLLVRKIAESPSSAAPTSATTRRTGSSVRGLLRRAFPSSAPAIHRNRRYSGGNRAKRASWTVAKPPDLRLSRLSNHREGINGTRKAERLAEAGHPVQELAAITGSARCRAARSSARSGTISRRTIFRIRRTSARSSPTTSSAPFSARTACRCSR